ncbi:acyl-CoA desaturase [Psychrobacter sp. B38]|uniref:fatty acid desaturase family protein n=1 Tax=Psychrobacter sp. B38 TaxID=3143538 RepID=UPI00320F82D2
MRLFPSTKAQSALTYSAPSNATQLGEHANVHSPTGRYPILTGTPLTKAQTEALGRELDDIYQRVMASLGGDEARYIQRIYATVAYSEVAGRGLLALAGRLSSKRFQGSTWLLGTALLSFSKILNNMELGHNVMHGQYDWMQHPHLNSQKYDWDNVCPAPLWQHSHNYLHHTFTNILGLDHDVGYHLIRITEEQTWTPSDRYNLLKTAVLALGFEWAVAFHDIQISVQEYADSPELHQTMQQKTRALLAKIARQLVKDYAVLPAAAGVTLGRRSALTTLTGNATANVARNLWTWAVIFCGHFTEQAHIYTHLDVNESKGDWYVRQILGSSNIEGSKWFHILTGNLSHQIEHHIFPDMPASRYADIAPQVRAICRKYHLEYNTGRFSTQFSQVLKRIHHFSKPTTEERRAYKQSLSEASKAAADRTDSNKEPSSGWSRFLPPILRHTLSYAK